ncbi:unnamed protein product [Vicia faba]|uniref:C2H2-type domain-containing protein n=1 Tax=Vicia faba TaxID=3906 RepID=A0AAV1B2S3_VICFA|nr:unnamed protein product [Vicia faba]
MESDQYEQGGGDDQGDAKQVVNLRSYECNFCKRGFSNAQALGGHMNIHRKDKAKLKQQSSNMEANSSDIQEANKLLLPNLNSNIVLCQSQQQDQHHAPRDVDETLVTQVRQQLPLFSESPTKSEMQKPQLSQGETTTAATSTTEEALLSSGQHSPMELDLELRLGPEPHDSSAPTGTRKFF